MDVGSIVSIAEITFQACSRLARFVKDSRHASEARNALYSEVTNLQDLIASVKAATSRRNSQLHFKPVSDEEATIYELLDDALRRCNSTIEEMSEKVQRLGDEATEPDWLGRAKLQRRLDRQNPGIVSLRRDMQAHISRLTLLSNHFLP